MGGMGYGAIMHAIAMRTEERTKEGPIDGKSERVVSNGEMKENEVEEKPNPSHSTSKNLSEDKTKEELYRSIAITRSKICKRNVVSHEDSERHTASWEW